MVPCALPELLRVAERHALDAVAISDQSADVRTVEYRVIDRYGDITIIWRYHDFSESILHVPDSLPATILFQAVLRYSSNFSRAAGCRRVSDQLPARELTVEV